MSLSSCSLLLSITPVPGSIVINIITTTISFLVHNV